MHYYQFNIGDYRKDTGHLSLLEHGIYRSLLDSYYLEEGALCANHAQLMRKHNVRSEDEICAFNNVIEDFFSLNDAQYHHKGCDKHLEKIYAKSTKARASAKARWKGKGDDAQAMRSPCADDANAMLPITHNPIPNKETLAQKDARLELKKIVDECFENFWLSGIRKLDKKRSRPVFHKAVSEQKLTPEEFTQSLITDVQKRISSNQMGFDKLHPRTYLSNERWNDEIIINNERTSNIQKLSAVERTKQATADWKKRVSNY